MRTLRHNLREFLFSNFQIGFKSQELLYKASCIELGTPHETLMKPNPICFTKQKLFEGREKDFES